MKIYRDLKFYIPLLNMLLSDLGRDSTHDVSTKANRPNNIILFILDIELELRKDNPASHFYRKYANPRPINLQYTIN